MQISKTIDNRYDLIKEVGRGGTSIVYLAYDNIREENIALKTLQPERAEARHIKSFNREAKAISALNSDNIIKVYDFGFDESSNTHYIAQEFIEGMTIREYLQTSKKITVSEVVSITTSILKGLKHAHDNGIIHKDIKGQNILIDLNKNIKIADFGIAHIIEDDATKTQSLMGTPQYVAPETLNKEDATAQTDIYSVGILMYELLMGHAPFKGESAPVVIMKQLNQPLPSIRQTRTEVNQALENIVIKATAKNTDNRYKTCDQMLEDLDLVFSPQRHNVPKLILENDLVNSSGAEHTILLDGDLNIDKIKKDVHQSNKSKRQRNILIIIICLLIPIALIIAFLFSSKNQTMGNYVSQNYEIAVDNLILAGIPEDHIKIEYEQNAEVPENDVIKTEPKEGERINKNTNVVLQVSTGPEMHIMLDYTGDSYESVKLKLETNGFIVNSSFEYSDEVENGKIISHDPEAGSEVEKGSKINFVVSKGKEPIKLPNFGLKQLSVAEQWLLEKELVMQTEYVCSSESKDTIIKQDPVDGTTVDSGSTVKLTVSNGTPCDSPTIESINIFSYLFNKTKVLWLNLVQF